MEAFLNGFRGGNAFQRNFLGRAAYFSKFTCNVLFINFLSVEYPLGKLPACRGF